METTKIKEERKYVSYDRRFLSTGLDIANMILLTEIENLSKLPKGCYATDEQLGQLILVGRQNTNERIKLLEKLEYIKCKTTFINKKRKRLISFIFEGVKSSQDDTPRRSHKSKVKSSQNDTPYTPKDDNNKLIKEVTPNPEEIEKEKEKETGRATGPKKENVEVSPTVFLNDVEEEKETSASISATIPAPVSLNIEKTSTSVNDIKKQKILNLEFISTDVREILSSVSYETLIEELNGDFQKTFGPLSQYQKYQLDVIINNK